RGLNACIAAKSARRRAWTGSAAGCGTGITAETGVVQGRMMTPDAASGIVRLTAARATVALVLTMRWCRAAIDAPLANSMNSEPGNGVGGEVSQSASRAGNEFELVIRKLR